MGSTGVSADVQSRVDRYWNTANENLIASRTGSCRKEVRTGTGTTIISVKCHQGSGAGDSERYVSTWSKNASDLTCIVAMGA
jgi:hypothetical protein